MELKEFKTFKQLEDTGYLHGLCNVLLQKDGDNYVIFKEGVTDDGKKFPYMLVNFISGVFKGENLKVRTSYEFMVKVEEIRGISGVPISSPLSKLSVMINQEIANFKHFAKEFNVFIDKTQTTDRKSRLFMIDGEAVELTNDEIDRFNIGLKDSDIELLSKLKKINNFYKQYYS